ncbi:MAG TPA: serine/threonine-protein kinase, partial [Acidimicrobiales bacterium]
MSTLRIADAVGRVLGGRYRLVRAIGSGASAHVYVADDTALRRRVAVKVLHPGLADDHAFLRRFRAEAQTVAALRHPNILRVYDWGEDEGSPYLVSELLEGGSLCSLLDAKHLLTPSQATAIGLAAADALDYAHRRGLVHRDIKPANLLFDEEGRLSVADFGLARALAEASLTEPAGAVVGTARYAAPEQLSGEVLDSRADVYSLALVLTEATSGIVPFAVDTPLGTRMARIARRLEVPPSAGPLVPILEAAGTVAPGDRLDAAGLVRQLGSLARSLPPPGPLPLAGPLVTGDVEVDVNPTMLAGPGRSSVAAGARSEVLFDPEAAEPAELAGLLRQPPAVRIDPQTGAVAGESSATPFDAGPATGQLPADQLPGGELADVVDADVADADVADGDGEEDWRGDGDKNWRGDGDEDWRDESDDWVEAGEVGPWPDDGVAADFDSD